MGARGGHALPGTEEDALPGRQLQKSRDPHIWLTPDSVIPEKQEVWSCS